MGKGVGREKEDRKKRMNGYRLIHCWKEESKEGWMGKEKDEEKDGKNGLEYSTFQNIMQIDFLVIFHKVSILYF